MPDRSRANLPALLAEPTLKPIVVLFFERSKHGFREMYTHTFKQRRAISGVYEDIAEGYQMALDHASAFSCPADVRQIGHRVDFHGRPTSNVLIEVRAQSPFPIADDGWEQWMGPGGQSHDTFRWAD